MSTRRRTASRGFIGTWGLLFAASVGGVQTARAVHTPVAEPEVEVVVAAVVAVPPKPQGAERAEGSGSGAFTWEGCAALTGAYADACFAGLAWQRAARDPDGALQACAAVHEPTRAQECVSDVAEGHTLTDRARAAAICATIPALRWRDQCVFGMALALVKTEPIEALQICERAGVWTRFCRHDVNGERAVQEPTASAAYCGVLAAQERPSCWHGVGKYLGRADPGLAGRTCGLAPVEQDLRGQCVHGLGWALAEAGGAAAAAGCARLGDEADSCVMGVAYHTKRVDPAAALALCDQVGERQEAARCREVVGRGVTVSAAAPAP